MKKKFLVTLLLVMTSLAEARTFKVIKRTENNRAKEAMVALSDLNSNHSFDGKYFKIVKGKSDQAVSFDADEGLVLRAATTYYHLSIARSYFIEHIKSPFVMNLPKMVIRIEHTNQFSELGHFANDNLDPQFNNALTIPAGEGLSSRGVRPWGREIWFRPKKKVHLSELNANNLAAMEFKVLMKNFRNQIHMQSLQRFLSVSIQALLNDNSKLGPQYLDNIIRTAGSSVIMEFGYQFIDPLTKLTSRKWYWLDTALVPEIIYHEYAHVALSDYLVLSHSSAIIEGMADFFAGQIAQSPQLALHIKKYNTFNGKDARKNEDYLIQFELGQYANTDFVFGLLWQLKSILGQAQGEAFMFELRKRLTTSSSIRVELVEAILKTCDEICESPFVDKISILKSLNLRGL